MRIALRAFGWMCIAAGALVALYLVYALYWTGRTTADAQDRLLAEFEGGVASDGTFSLGVGELEPLEQASAEPLAPVDLAVGDAVGVIRFHRPGATEPLVVDQPLVVVEGVGVEPLKAGPGRYPGSEPIGAPGNFAVAGHRTTYGAPFWSLDDLEAGDEVHVTDRDGRTWVYEFAESRIVAPSDVSVLADDPLGSGRPVLTLTTCHPRWSQTERLIVFAELQGTA